MVLEGMANEVSQVMTEDALMVARERTPVAWIHVEIFVVDDGLLPSAALYCLAHGDWNTLLLVAAGFGLLFQKPGVLLEEHVVLVADIDPLLVEA